MAAKRKKQFEYTLWGLIREKAAQRSLSDDDIANLMGIQPGHISAMDNGTALPGHPLFVRDGYRVIAKAIGESWQDLQRLASVEGKQGPPKIKRQVKGVIVEDR